MTTFLKDVSKKWNMQRLRRIFDSTKKREIILLFYELSLLFQKKIRNNSKNYANDLPGLTILTNIENKYT